MGEKNSKIDIEVKKIHNQIKRSNLVLRERMQDLCENLTEWNLLDGHNVERVKGEEDYLR